MDFRGTCLSRFPDEVVSANWDSMVFDTGERALQRIPMMEPGKGTEGAVGALLFAVGDQRPGTHRSTPLLRRWQEKLSTT